MIVVSDTTPLISLMKADQLELLQKMFGKILIPHAVFTELTTNLSFEDEAEKIKNRYLFSTRFAGLLNRGDALRYAHSLRSHTPLREAYFRRKRGFRRK